MNYGVQKCIWTALGDITANFIQATLVIFVLGSFFVDNPNFLNKFKWIGIAYLLYLAYDLYKSGPKKNALKIFFNYKGFMKKKGHRPITRIKNPEPNIEDPDWVIWAAWADRITFEEIEKKTGQNESQVIKIMRRSLRPSSFRLWRKRVNQKSIKHRKKFEYSRKQITSKIKKGDYL